MKIAAGFRCLALALVFSLTAVLPGRAEEKPDAAVALAQLDWMPGDYAVFLRWLDQAKAAELAEAQMLLPQMEAALLFADLDQLRALIPKVDSSKAEILKRKGGADLDLETINHSLKLARMLVALADKQPTEVARRAEIFRCTLFLQQTMEEVRLLDSALDQLAIEKNLAEGTEVTWQQVRVYLRKDSQLYGAGATIFGDSYGPFKIGTTPSVPRPTYLKLKDYQPPEAWESFAPKD